MVKAFKKKDDSINIPMMLFELLVYISSVIVIPTPGSSFLSVIIPSRGANKSHSPQYHGWQVLSLPFPPVSSGYGNQHYGTPERVGRLA